MVVFTCNHCGDSLQKPRVEKHYQTVCRRVKSLTCVDCLKDFHGQDYNVHIKCVTEQERYAAKGSMPNGVVKKGEAKQESWVDMIRSIIDKEQTLIPAHRNLLDTISQYDNVPRKQHKFMNFIRSSSGGRVNMKDVEAVWNIIEKYKAETTRPNPEVTKDEKDKENASKRKLEDNQVEDTPAKKKKSENTEICKDETATKFSYEDKITSILNKKKTISLKKLQKKVLNAYLKHSGLDQQTEKNAKKFNKKLHKMSHVKIELDNVILIE